MWLWLLMATFYIAAAGSDSNPGTQAQPWATVTKVNAQSPNPGDTFLFNGGDTFSNQLVPPASGSAGNPITYASYGTGQAIINATNVSDVLITNLSYLTIQDLILDGVGVNSTTGKMNDGSTNQQYLVDIGSTLNSGTCTSIKILGCEIRNGYGGILLHGDGSTAPVGYSACEFGASPNNPLLIHDNLAMGIWTHGSVAFSSTGSPYNLAKGTLHSTVNIHDFEIYNIWGIPNGNDGTVINFFGSGLVVANMATGTVTRGTIHDTGKLNNDSTGRGGPVNFMTIESSGITVTAVEAYNAHTSNVDGLGIDFDGGSSNCRAYQCYSHNNIASPYATGTFTGSSATSTITFENCIGEINGSGSTNGVHRFGTCTGLVVKQCDFYLDETQATSSACAGLYAQQGDSFTNNLIIVSGIRPLIQIQSSVTAVTIQGNAYYSVAGTPHWGSNPDSMTWTTLAGFRTSSLAPELNGASPIGSYGNPLVPSSTGNTINNYAKMNSLLTVYDPASNSPIVNAGFGSTPTDADFHNRTAQVTTLPVGAVYQLITALGGISRVRLQVGM